MRPVPKQAKMFAPTPAIARVDVRIAEPVASCYCPRPHGGSRARGIGANHP